jgi:hypothetical protein
MVKSLERLPARRKATPMPRLQAKDMGEITTLVPSWFSAVGRQIIFYAVPTRSLLDSFSEQGAC